MMLNPNDPNVAMLELVSQRLSAELRLRLVFTGGAVVGLLVTDPAMPSIRPTEDVDLMVQVLARAEFHEVEASLRSLGFVPDMSPAAPICRWRIDQITVDVMPTLETILGFSNRWYPLAVQTAQTLTLPSGQDTCLQTQPVNRAFRTCCASCEPWVRWHDQSCHPITRIKAPSASALPTHSALNPLLMRSS
jgi:hypothetical protein